MKNLGRLLGAWLLICSCGNWRFAQTGPRTLILGDAPPYGLRKLGMSCMPSCCGNLLGHFDSKVDMVAVQNYTAGPAQRLRRYVLSELVLRQPGFCRLS